MNEWVWSIGGMVLTGEIWSTGRKTLFSLGGRWMNGHGALVEWNLQGKTEILGEKHVPVPLCPPQISNGLIRDQTRASASRGRPPTAWHGVSVSPFTFACCTYRAVEDGTRLCWGTSVRSCLRHCATRWKFAGSITDAVVEISGRTMSLRLPHPLTESSTVNILWRTGGVGEVFAFGWQPYDLHMPIVLKSRRLNLLEPSEPVQLLLYLYLTCKMFKIVFGICWQHNGPLWMVWICRTRFWIKVKAFWRVTPCYSMDSCHSLWRT